MSKLDTNFVKELYANNGVELTPEKLNYITTNYSSNEDLQFEFNKKYLSNSDVQTEVTPEKKNSDVTSVSTLEVPQSESPLQQPQRKATSVGEKPKTTGASVSSAGKGKKVGGKEVKKTSSSEDLISKFGFKDKEEQKKAGVVASKTKVDVKTPSAVKPVSVKEEQFVKPELQKIQEEVSSPEFKKELEENKESILSKEQRGLISSGIDSSIEMKQAEGLLPPTSELIKSGDIKLNIYSGGQFEELLKPKSFTEQIAQQSKPFELQVKETFKPVKVNYDNLMLSKDYNLKYPYLYYSNSKNGGDIQVNELYTNNLSSLPINKDDFDGFLRKKGFLDDFNKDLSSGLYNEDRGTFSENYNAKLIKEKRLVDFLSMYISDRNQRDYDKRVIEYKKENPKATAEDIDKNVSKFTFVSDQQFGDYIKNTFPTYSKNLEDRKIKEKKEYEETKKNKGDFFSWQTLKKIGSGLSETISNRVSNLSSTVYDLIGMEDTAKQIRFSAEEDAFNRPENRDISYVSGKKVLYDGNEYLVDSNGQIYDYNLKKRVTDLFMDAEPVIKAAKNGKEDYLFSWTGTTIQTTNVLADLVLQIALTRGAGTSANIIKSGLSKEGLAILSKIPVSQGMASSATAQTFLGYSEGLEGTLVAAKNAGISDSEAKALANDAAMKTAGLYLVTSGISPQTKATFVKQKNELIKEAIDVYAKKGKTAYVKFLNNGIDGLKKFVVEGGKETGQELIQTGGTVYGVNQSINEQAGQEILQSEITADQVISMLPSTFVAGGIPIMLRNIGGTFSKKDYLSNLDTASNNVDLSNKRLDELLSNNVITPEEHATSKEDLRVYSQNKNKIPKDTSAEIVLDVAKGLDEISKLESQKQNLDKSFHEGIDEKINKKREEIKDLYNKSKEDESTKQATGQVSEQEIKPTTTEAETPITTQQVDAGLQTQEKVVEPTIKDSQIPLKRETFEVELVDGSSASIVVTTKKDGSKKIIQKDAEGNTVGSENLSKDNTLTTEDYIAKAYGDIKGEPKVEQGNDIINPAMKAKLTPQQKAELGIKEEVITPKTEEDAVQKQITDEGVLQPKQSEMGLQEMEQGDKINQVVAEQGKKEIVPGSKDVVSGVEITYPTVEQETERKDFRSKTEYVEEASKDLDVEDTTVMSKELEGDFGLLTAENPMAKPLTESENVSLNKKAKQWLESRGYKPRRLTGKYTQAENSFFVPNLSKADAVAFAKEFNQDSVAHSEGLIYQDGSMNPRVKADDDFSFSKGYDVNSDNVSVVKTPDGLKTFSVGYDFSQRVQPETSQGREVSKNINEAKKQVANISDKKIAKSVLNGVKAISKILPNVKVILHDTDDSFRSVSGESKNQESSGLYQNGEIHINLPKANRRTVAHEIFHAILLGKVKTDANAQTVTKKMIESIASKIDNNPDLKAKLDDFASMYDENIQDEEKLAELVGIMAQNYDSLSTRVKEIIKNWLNNLAKSFGVKLFESNEVFDVLNTIAKKVATGTEITVENVSTLDNGTNPIGNPTEIRMPKKRESKINFKDSYENSLVTPDKKVDIYSLLEDIVAKKQKVWFWVADQLGVNKDFDGGPSFAHKKEGDIWASSMSVNSINNNINKSDYIFIISGSPLVSKLFNKKVFDKMVSKFGDFNAFKSDVLKTKPTKDITDILNNFKSWDDLRNSTSRKPFLIAINESSKKPNTEFHKYVKSLNGYFNLDDFRDGFYKNNGFEQNDIMLVLKPTGVRAGSDHSTYENTVEGEVIGVPDAKINALEVMPKEMADKYSGKAAQASQAIAPYGSGVKEVVTVPSKRQQKSLPVKVAEKLTEDGDGNFVFKHYSDKKRDVIKTGQGNNAITSREEASALSAVGGLAMFYTMEGQKETGVGNVEHNILVPMDKVYDIDSDPLGFEKEAKKRFNEVRPGQAFTNNHRGAFITQVANENGFDVAVTQWRGSELRAQTTKELTPSDKSVDFKERPLETFKDGDYAIIDGRESLITNVDGNKLRYESLDGLAKGTTINNEKNRRSIIKIDKPSVRMQKPKKLSTQINKVVGVKPKATEQKRIDKAFGLGIAEQKVLTDDIKAQLNEMVSVAKEALKIEKDRNKVIQKLRQEASKFVKDAISGLKDGDIAKRTINSVISKINSITDANFDDKVVEINQALDKTYTNRDIKKANSDSKKALDNVMSGKIGKLSEDGSAKDVMSSKIVGFASFVPIIVKRVASEVDFQQYLDYLSRLAEKREALSDTDLKTFNKIYDALSDKYNEFVDKVNAIQSKIDNNRPQDINADEKKFFDANKDLFYEYEDPTEVAKKKEERDAKKEEAIAKKKERIKELLPSIKDVFIASNAPKTSFVWRMLSTLSTLDDSDIDAMPENMLSNTENTLNSMVFDDVIPTYAENLYRFTLKNKAKKIISETIERSGKEGLYKYGFFQALGNIKDAIINPISTSKAILNGTLNEKLIEKRVEAMKLVAIDAALKVYGDTPIYNYVISVLGKGHSYMNSEVLEAEEILSNAKKMLDNKSKTPSESYMKITYYLIDQMAKSNQGTTSSIPAIDYFEATINDPESKIRKDNRQLKKLKEFVANIESYKDKNGDLILTKEEINAANAIRSVLDKNKRNAYEANTYQNGNSSPMINNYFSVTNNINGQAENDVKSMQNKFSPASTKAGQLYDKTGTAHPISMNPFATTISSVKNVSVQFNLRSEIMAFTQALNEGIKESEGNTKQQTFFRAIRNSLNKQVEILAGSSNFAPPTILDTFWDSVDKVFYQQALGSFISRSVDFAGNLAVLAAVDPMVVSKGNAISRSLNDFYENNNKEGLSKNKILRDFLRNAEASQINKIVSSKDASLERTEFLNKGVDKDLLDKGLPTDSTVIRGGRKVLKPVDDISTTINEWVLSFGDVKPYGIAWMGTFADQFKKQAGEDIDAKKISEGDVEYLKKYKDVIRNASNIANQETADLYGTNNQFEKATEIAYAVSGRNNTRGLLSSVYNRSRFLLTAFVNGALSSVNNASNAFVEKSGNRREASKILGGVIRLAGYKVATDALTGLIASAFRSDDDDEEKIKDAFDKLYDDSDFIKNVNNLLDITKKKEDVDDLTADEFKEYQKARAELLKNPEFKKAFDVFYGYVNRATLSDAVIMRTNYVNKQNILFSVSDIKSSFENLKKGYGINDDNIVNILSWLHSERGRSILDPKDREEYISSLEQFLKETNYRYRAADRENLSNLDERIIIQLSEVLSEYRNKGVLDKLTEQGLVTLTQMALSRADNYIRGGVNWTLENANKYRIESERGERGYNFYTDQIFNPMVNFGLLNKDKPSSNAEIVTQVAGVLLPIIRSLPTPEFDKDLQGRDIITENESVDLLRYNKTLATFGLNDLKKIHSSLKNDKVYMETSDKFKKNIIREISKDKIDFLRREEMIQKDIEREKQYKSNVIMPKDTTYQRSKFSDFRSKNDKNLKVNSKSIK